MTSIKSTEKHEENIMIRLNNLVSEHPMPKSEVSACSDRIKHVSIPFNKYNKANILAGILCRMRFRGFKCIIISSLLRLQWCLLLSEGELKKFIRNKL